LCLIFGTKNSEHQGTPGVFGSAVSTTQAKPASSQKKQVLFYTSYDQRAFQAEALQEGSRINLLIPQCSVPKGRAIYDLMERNLLSNEDILGIRICWEEKPKS
jgi:hypothetical protein